MFASPPVIVDVSPPRNSRTMYKVVALVNDMPTSIFDGITVYPVGATIFQMSQENHGGGLYCFKTIEECLARDDATFPPSCALLTAPRTIIRVQAWNSEDTLIPISYGDKKSFSYVHVLQVIPMPLSYTIKRRAQIQGAEGNMLQGAVTVVGGPSERIREESLQGSNMRIPSQLSPKLVSSPPVQNYPGMRPSGDPQRLARTQARTLKLEMEVAELENRLLLARGLGIAS